ncbi:hypothetical protein ACNFU2_20410 [Chryseobacterium sp. PTM-20240506]|uniref:hypothetical protein n=1 Tax=unclassified Chryseobacterium TaxID=2593645 RepID=UPI002358A701|nr:hypothetical protein [Chryseobacterium sp. B21-037]MDC8102955.1 hypothetical protein [Chryseobacterium sp. B21-037]
MRKTLILLTTMLLITSCSSDDEVLVNNTDIKKNSKIQSSKIELESKSAPPSPFIAYNGDFARVNDNGHTLYYIKFMGKWRHIDNQATWDGLFINKSFKFDLPSISSLISTTQTEVRTPIFLDNGLMQNPNNGKIYFREGSTLRWIPTMDIFNQYHFNPAVVVQSTETENPSKYTQLPDFKDGIYD